MNNLTLYLIKLGTEKGEFTKRIEIPLDDVISVDISNGVQVFSISDSNRDVFAEGIQIRANRVLRIIPSAANSIFLSTD